MAESAGDTALQAERAVLAWRRTQVSLLLAACLAWRSAMWMWPAWRRCWRCRAGPVSAGCTAEGWACCIASRATQPPGACCSVPWRWRAWC
ncbi:TPA: DUF202 domain-containing protein [Pseudomonas putida]|nr:DUF202 domain-containing protein [Pseudomonas putida]MDD2152543.1 DUF202 domain-containing protein [Pseudomonas putida]HDS1679232.1 DUF202 domain-containing protein [Pseudomonas putida]